jgi:hypothetical protein
MLSVRNFAKAVSVFLSFIVLFVLSSLGTPANASTPINGTYLCSTGLITTVEYPTYDITAGVVSNGRNCAGVVVIPEGVTAIGGSAFVFSTEVASISLPSTVTSIGAYAFASARALTFIHIPSNVSSIGNGAFAYTTGLNSITVDPANVNYSDVNGVLFNVDATTLIAYPVGDPATSYLIPSSVSTIGNSSFMGASGLTSIDIPSGVIAIRDYAFSGASALTSINIPANVTYIGMQTLAGATSLASITVDPVNANYSAINGVLFDKNATKLIAYPVGDPTTSYSIPSSVSTIGDSSFLGASALTSITIPSGVTFIEDYAFSGASGLTSIDIPASVISIGDDAFSYTSALTSINIPSSVIAIGGFAFAGASALTSIDIPASVSSIGNFAFVDASALTSITVDPANANYSATNGVLFDKNSTTLFAYPAGNIAPSYLIPPGVTTISSAAFSGASALTSIDIPSSVAFIGESVFSGASALTRVYFLGNAPTLGLYAFNNIGASPKAYLKAANASSFTPLVDGKWNGLIVETVDPPLVNTPVVSTPGPVVDTAAQLATADLAARTVGVKKSFAAKSLAAKVGIKTVSPKATVTFSIAKSSNKTCTKSGTKLKTVKAGNCVVTFTVQEPKPKKGKKPKATKTVKILVVK